MEETIREEETALSTALNLRTGVRMQFQPTYPIYEVNLFILLSEYRQMAEINSLHGFP